MIQYLLFQEPQRWGEPIFSTLNVIMWSKTEDNLCTTELEQEVRKLLLWLNNHAKNYHIDMVKPETKGLKNGSIVIFGSGGRGVSDQPMTKYIVNVDEETAVIMKLFFPKFEPIPPPDPPVEIEIVAIDPSSEDGCEDGVVVVKVDIEPNIIPWWRRLLPTN